MSTDWAIGGKTVQSLSIGGKEVKKMVRVSDNTIIYEKVADNYALSLTADNEYISVPNSATLTATLTNNSNPVSGETIIFAGDGLYSNDVSATGNAVRVELGTDEFTVTSGGVMLGQMTGAKLQFNYNNNHKITYWTSSSSTTDLVQSTPWIRVDGTTVYYEGGSLDISSYDIDVSYMYIAYGNVRIYKDYIDSGTTNNNGVATATYAPVATGDVTVIAKWNSLQDSIQLHVS